MADMRLLSSFICQENGDHVRAARLLPPHGGSCLTGGAWPKVSWDDALLFLRRYGVSWLGGYLG